MELAKHLIEHLAKLLGLRAEIVKETAIMMYARLLNGAGEIVGHLKLEHRASTDKLSVRLWL